MKGFFPAGRDHGVTVAVATLLIRDAADDPAPK
jgi:hypothetical protein